VEKQREEKEERGKTKEKRRVVSCLINIRTSSTLSRAFAKERKEREGKVETRGEKKKGGRKKKERKEIIRKWEEGRNRRVWGESERRCL
jgi:hypothetical protein